MSETHADASTHDALAMSLEGFALFADRFRERLAEVPEFDLDIIDEAVALAHRLREQSALKVASPERSQQQKFMSLRNSLITLLNERVTAARRAARYVFRHHPEIAAKFASDYERRKRARRRLALKRESGATEQATV